MASAEAPYEDLFFRETVGGYVDNPRFFRRDWLAAEVNDRLRLPDCRFVLLTAEPGAGKSAFIAQLANDNPDRPVYFIRRDQQTPLADAGAHSFLLRIGYQLAASYPALFEPEQLEVSISQRVESLATGAEAIGAEVQRVLASPFYRRVAQIRQEIGRSEGKTVGLRVSEWIAEPYLLPLNDLQHMALIDPALTLLREQPGKQLVILVDALDELSYQPDGPTLLDWLANSPRLPANIRFVLTSRPPDERLRLFADKQAPYLQTIAIDPDSEHIGRELRTYATQLAGQPRIASLLAAAGRPEDGFVDRVVEKAEGNIGYLDAIARALDHALAKSPPDEALILNLLRLQTLPDKLGGLYAFFLGQIRSGLSQADRQMWPAVYKPLLGVLAVARQPVTLIQLRRMAGFEEAELDYLLDALDRLRPFLDLSPEQRMRFYHATLPEFLTDPATEQNLNTAVFYCNPTRWHFQIADYYWNAHREDWSAIDGYGLSSLATHLFQAKDGRLQTLIGKEWMLAHTVGDGYAGFLYDVDLAWQATLAEGQEKENLSTLVRLEMARQVVGQEVGAYSDTDLQTLVWLGRKAEALAHARLRHTLPDQCAGLLTIIHALPAEDRQNDGLLDEVWNLAGAIEDESDRQPVLGPLAVALAQGGRHERAAEAIRSLRNADSRATAQVEVAVLLAESGQYERAVALARTIAQGGERVKALRQIAKALAANQDQEASQILAEAVQTAHAIQDDEELHQLGLTLFEMGRYEQAEQAIYSIQDQPGWARALCDLALELARAGDRRASQVFSQAEEVVRAIPRGFGEQALALVKLASALVPVDGNRASQLFAEAEAIAPARDEIYASRARVLAELGAALARVEEREADRVFAVAREAALYEQKRTGTEWGEGWQDESLGKLADKLMEVERYQEAREVVRDMQEAFMQGETLYKLVKTLGQIERYAEAEEVARDIPVLHIRAAALSDLANNCARAGDIGAARLFTEAQIAARSQHDMPQAATLSGMAKALIHLEKYEAAEAIAPVIMDDREKGEALHLLAAQLAKIGRYDKAKTITQAITHDRTRAQGFHDLALFLADDGRYEEAETVIQAIPDSEGRNWAPSYIEDLEDARFWEAANEASEALYYAELRGKACQRLVAKLAQSGYFERAEKVAGSIQAAWIRAGAFADVAGALERAGDRRAAALFDEGKKTALAMKDPRDQDIGQREWALALARTGHYDEAEATLRSTRSEEGLRDFVLILIEADYLDNAWGVARTIRDRAQQSLALSDLSAALVQARRLEEAKAAADEIPLDLYRDVALHALALALTHFGQVHEAQASAQAILDPRYHLQAVVEVAAKLAQIGDKRSHSLFDEAWGNARTIQNKALRSKMLCYVAIALDRVGDGRAPQAFAEAEATAYEIPELLREDRQKALVGLATSMADAGHFSKSLRLIDFIGQDGFVKILTEWAPILERQAPGLFFVVLREAIEVCGWINPGWCKIQELLAGSS